MRNDFIVVESVLILITISNRYSMYIALFQLLDDRNKS